jgi:hypothetical protein
MTAVTANQSPPAIATAQGLASQFMLGKRSRASESFVSGLINGLPFLLYPNRESGCLN